MKLGFLFGYSGSKISMPMDIIKRAEALGYDSVWTAEAYGSDAVTPAAWILAQTERIKVGTAIMQVPSRTPAMAAMTSMTLAQLSGGRFILGVGASGPQVIEGWHGTPYGKPVTRVREYIEIVKKIFAREGVLTYEGDQYKIPCLAEGSTGLGKPLKSILHCTEDIPIYTASITPAGVAMAASVADGFFPVWMDPDQFDIFAEPVERGLARAGNGKTHSDFAIAPFVTVFMDDDINRARAMVKGGMALYIGGMGARNKNFYNDYAKRLGFEEAAVKIQDLYLSGKRDEAAHAVPDELVDACHLVGPKERIRDRMSRWIEAGKKGHVDSMLLAVRQPEALELMAEIVL